MIEITTSYDSFGFVAETVSGQKTVSHYAGPRQAAEALAHEVLGADAHVTFIRRDKYAAQVKPQFAKS